MSSGGLGKPLVSPKIGVLQHVSYEA